MRSILLFILFLSVSKGLLAQNNVGIGTNAPNPKSLLELSANDKGLLIPRLTTAQRLAIAPVGPGDAALLVYDTQDNLFYFWNSAQWVPFPLAGGSDNISFTYDPLTGLLTVTDGAGALTVNLPVDNDSDPANEVQQLTLNGNTLNLSISNNTIDLTPFLDNTDDQNLTSAVLNGTVLTVTIQNGNPVSVDLASLIGTDNQNLNLAGSNLSISGGNTVDLTPFLDNTDNQNLTSAVLNGTVLTVTIQNGNPVSVDLASLIGTDNQNLNLAGNNLSISGGNTVNLSPFLDNTDSQTLTLAGNQLSISGGNSVDLTPFANDWKLTGNAGTGPAINFLGTTDAQDLVFRTNNVERIRTTAANGNVGIGTATPGRRLEVSIDQNVGHIQAASSVFRLRNANTVTCNTDKAWDFRVGNCGQLGLTTYAGNGTPNFNILRSDAQNDNATASSGPVVSFNTSAPLNSIIMDGNGNVGIGFVSPAEKLEVSGSGLITGCLRVGISALNSGDGSISVFGPGLSGYQGFAHFRNPATGNAPSDGGIVGMENTVLRITNYENDNLELATANLARWRVTAAGHLRPAADNTFMIGSAALRVTEVWSVNGTLQTSDIRLKEKVEGLTYGLDEILGINPISFRWKESGDTSIHLGFSAQQLRKVLPEVVTESDDETKRLSVNYSELIPVLVRAIQEQQEQIDFLKSEKSTWENADQVMRNQLDLLKSEVDQLKTRMGNTTQIGSR